MLRACAIATVLLGVNAASAGTVSDSSFLARNTGDLVELCTPASTDPLGAYAVTFCQGFVQGAVAVEMQHGFASGIPMFCLPAPRPTRSETILAFVGWARAVPARLNLSPEEGILTFLSMHYPCPGRG